MSDARIISRCSICKTKLTDPSLSGLCVVCVRQSKEKDCIRCRIRPAYNQKALLGLCTFCLETKKATYVGETQVKCVLCSILITVKRMLNSTGSSILVPPLNVRYVSTSGLTGHLHDECYEKAKIIAEPIILRRPTKPSVSGIRNRRLSLEK